MERGGFRRLEFPYFNLLALSLNSRNLPLSSCQVRSIRFSILHSLKILAHAPIKLWSLIKPIEPSGDSHMRTSSDEDESETLFPSANDPPLGEEMTSSTIFPTELSPPTSQDPPDPTEWEGFQDENLDQVPPDAPRMARSKDGEGRSGTIYGLNGNSSHPLLNEDCEQSEAEHEPGHAWRNAKAMEEYHKSMEQVTDRSFSLSKSTCMS